MEMEAFEQARNHHQVTSLNKTKMGENIVTHSSLFLSSITSLKKKNLQNYTVVLKARSKYVRLLRSPAHPDALSFSHSLPRSAF